MTSAATHALLEQARLLSVMGWTERLSAFELATIAECVERHDAAPDAFALTDAEAGVLEQAADAMMEDLRRAFPTGCMCVRTVDPNPTPMFWAEPA